jgi:uncharacterized protein YjbI with pentapeptide repeats
VVLVAVVVGVAVLVAVVVVVVVVVVVGVAVVMTFPIEPSVDLSNTCLARHDLTGSDLSRALLRRADLDGAVLDDANLRLANLHAAYLEGASLVRADLRSADLRLTRLEGARLCGANLSWALMFGADLSWANLSYANLEKADLRHTVLAHTILDGANLRGTVLDPLAPMPEVSDEELLAEGFHLRGDRVYGWRTAVSTMSGEAYVPGTTVRAPYFSLDVSTCCHPGIYLAGLDWLRTFYPREPLVYVSCRRGDILHAGSKWRAKEIKVIRAEEPAGARARTGAKS